MQRRASPDTLSQEYLVHPGGRQFRINPRLVVLECFRQARAATWWRVTFTDEQKGARFRSADLCSGLVQSGVTGGSSNS